MRVKTKAETASIPRRLAVTEADAGRFGGHRTPIGHAAGK
jgi:hypothetical protein